jgi:hypothetical protein
MPRFAKSDTALSVEKISEFVSYDPNTGDFTWRVARLSFGGKAKAGTVAGTIDKNGYRIIGIAGQRYWAHRLAWYVYYGKWPTGQIDHVNMDPLDNRIANLREATMTQQRGNQRVRKDSASGIKGVSQTLGGRWIARIRYRGICVDLGRFDDPQSAQEAYQLSARSLYGEFARVA